MKKSIFGISFLTLIGLFLFPSAVSANCAGSIPLEEAQKLFQPRWQNLQSRGNYPWGNEKVYGSWQGTRINLTSQFDQLSGSEKLDALNLLEITGLPFNVYASDGRIISGSYDGCTRFNLLTEKARYSWYFNERGRSLPVDKVSVEDLRNAGRPSWRNVKFPITVAQEKKVRSLFWQQMGYDSVKAGLWIAWVPEHGYFEVDIPDNYDLQKLSAFWKVAPRQYLYKVIAPDGTLRMDATFDCDRC